MTDSPGSDGRTLWRRRLFFAALSSLATLALLLFVGAPLSAQAGNPGALEPVIFAVEMALLVTVLGWLGLLVFTKPSKPRSD